MVSLAYVTGIIARRLGHTQASAAAIVQLLSERKRECVELAARDVGATVQIAALVYGARKRAAAALPTADARRQALAAAKQEAAEHYKLIEAEPEPLSLARGSDARSGGGIRTVPAPTWADEE